ncbi:MAG TPA: 16S rRNA (guanine(966)-N(2))-methyltransferase RsmD [Bacteroidota bacterium]|nr:16S rRNA (guanine(966)-N(2))-methyltransferase RsmD [Bacteroidota bacterium]
MRVIAGTYKGRRLRTVADLTVRPATSRVKGSIFNILQNRIAWPDTRVLDLFAGSGSLGIEALSRGAPHAVFVENSKRPLAYLKENIAAMGAEGRSEVIASDAFDYLSRPREPFDIVFADPPYELEVLNRLPSLIFQSGVVAPTGYLIIEHPQQMKFEPSLLWEEAVVRKYGRTVVTFFQSQTLDRP